MYTTVNGNKVPIEYYVTEENFDKAEHFIDLYEQSCRILEKYFGEYPWVKEANPVLLKRPILAWSIKQILLMVINIAMKN